MSASTPSPASHRQLEDCDVSRHPLQTADGLELALFRALRHTEAPPVLLVHNLGISSEMFTEPHVYSLCAYLLDHGFGDVWLLDWRSSSLYGDRYTAREDGMDEVARYDLPAAVAAVVEARGGESPHVIANCLGAMGMCMAVTAGHVRGLRSLVAGTVGLFPDLGPLATAKLWTMPSFAREALSTSVLEPDPAAMRLGGADAMLRLAAQAGENQCDSAVCRQLSFMYGAGHPSTLFLHHNLHPGTHDALAGLYGPVALSYLEHVRVMSLHSAVVQWRAPEQGPRFDYLGHSDRIDCPLLLLTGGDNRLWYRSAQKYAALLEQHFPSVDAELLVVDGYAHNDLFFGVDAHHDVFPHLVSWIPT